VCWWFHRVAHALWAAARRSLLVCANHGRDYHATWPAPATSHISHAFCHDFSWYNTNSTEYNWRPWLWHTIMVTTCSLQIFCIITCQIQFKLLIIGNRKFVFGQITDFTDGSESATTQLVIGKLHYCYCTWNYYKACWRHTTVHISAHPIPRLKVHIFMCFYMIGGANVAYCYNWQQCVKYNIIAYVVDNMFLIIVTYMYALVIKTVSIGKLSIELESTMV